jgi:hypothetical protein
MGMIYAQEADDSELTTFEEEALNDEEEITAGTSDKDTSAYLSGRAVSGDDNTTDAASETEIADISSLFANLVVCDLGSVTANAPDETAIAAEANLTTPTVSVTVMSETEVAEAAANETQIAAANGTEVASAQCFSMGGDDDNSTSTSSTADDMSNATSDGNATSLPDSNATSTMAANATSSASNATGSANATSSTNATSTAADHEQIAVIEGEDFAPGEIVLVFSSNNIVAIDDVDNNGDIDAAVPMDNVGNDFTFVESGTTRTAEFNFDGQTLIAAEGVGDIQAEGTNQDELDVSEILRDLNTTSSNTNSTSVQ